MTPSVYTVPDTASQIQQSIPIYVRQSVSPDITSELNDFDLDIWCALYGSYYVAETFLHFHLLYCMYNLFDVK